VREIGLDVHRDFCEVAISDKGEVRSAPRIKTAPAELELFARSLGPEDRVALEVTGNAWSVARVIEPHVAEVLVVSPNETGIRQARAKTDRLDARALARLLAAGSLEGLWMPDAPTRALRRRLQRRSQLVRARTRPGPGLLGIGSRSPQGHIRGHNLHETEGNSDQQEPHRNAETDLERTPATQLAHSAGGRKVAGSNPVALTFSW